MPTFELTLQEVTPRDREEVKAKTYAYELAEWIAEQGWDATFFASALLWAWQLYRQRQEATA